MFYVGQKVVCVGAKARPGRIWGADRPVEGATYTIVGFSKSLYDGRETLCFEEIKNSSVVGPGYHARRFRPIVERKTDISIFKAMLNPSKQGADA